MSSMDAVTEMIRGDQLSGNGRAMTADESSLLDIDAETFRASFNRKPFLVRHHLADNRLFALPRLIELSRRLPKEDVEYNAGDIPVNQDPMLTPRTGLSIQETIRRIEDCRSWLVLKNVERDAEYNALLNCCLDQIETLFDSKTTGMCNRQGFIFISSPSSVTPYHMDPEHNFLLQIRGKKYVNIFDGADRSVLSEQELERYLAGAHRNLIFKDEYQQKASVFELTPGQGLHFPVTAPHWVKNGDEVSISFSITFHTPASERRKVVYEVNNRLRGKGINPLPFGRSFLRDSAKFYAFRALRRGKRFIGRG